MLLSRSCWQCITGFALVAFPFPLRCLGCQVPHEAVLLLAAVTPLVVAEADLGCVGIMEALRNSYQLF
jgi:hypothetical protein